MSDEHGIDIPEPNMWGVSLGDCQGERTSEIEKYIEHCHYNIETLRDKFAMAALSKQVGSPEDVARWSYQVADAMLAERDK